jgi:beta-N-acetylhexosaminidase
MGVSRRRIIWRRIVAVAAVVVSTGAIALALSDEGTEVASPPAVSGGGVPGGVRDLLRDLTLEQKVDQVLALGFEGTEASPALLERLAARQLGAIYVGSQNWLDATQGSALIESLKGAASGDSRVPPLIVTSQVGGSERALGDLPPAASALSIGATGDPQRARRWARAAAEALAAVGVDLNLAPVADLIGLENPLAERSFGERAELTAQMVLAAEIGCTEADVGCAIAHFPGAGAASQNTDLGPATVGTDRAGLVRRDLLPFRVGFQAGAPAVVVSHAFYAAIAPVTPASQSPAIATGLLRETTGFDGAAISDDLSAGAITALGPVRDAAVESLLAGIDLLLIERAGAAQEVTRAALLRAARDGTIPRPRLNEAAGRVLELKRTLGLL